PFTLEEAEEALECQEHPGQRARPQALAAPLRHEGAHIGAAQPLERIERYRAAGMAGEELQELIEIAAIGVERIGGQPAHRAEFALPGTDPGADKLVGGKSGIDHGSNFGLQSKPELNAADPDRPGVAYQQQPEPGRQHTGVRAFRAAASRAMATL